MHLEVDQKYYLRQKKKDGGVLPVLDSLDNYTKILSERKRVNPVLFIFPLGELKFRVDQRATGISCINIILILKIYLHLHIHV